MTTPAAHTLAHDGLTLLLGPRQAEMMRLFWTYGSATVRQLQQWLKDSDLAYNTVATLCARLAEKGLLRQHVGMAERHNRGVAASIYTPLIAEADFVRAAVAQQLDDLLAHYPDLVCAYVMQYAQHAGAGGPGEATDDRATQDNIEIHNSKLKTQDSELAAALLERAVAAERHAATWEAEARRAQHQTWTATARYKKAQAQALEWEATAHRAAAQALAAEEEADAIMRRATLQQHAATRSAPEYFDGAGVCRVCNAPVPDAPARRRDGLRVCEAESCRQEARRRDHAAKQRQQRARWRQRLSTKARSRDSMQPRAWPLAVYDEV